MRNKKNIYLGGGGVYNTLHIYICRVQAQDCAYVSQALRHTKEIPPCRGHQKTTSELVPDWDSTREEELNNLSLIHGSTYSRIPFWRCSRKAVAQHSDLSLRYAGGDKTERNVLCELDFVKPKNRFGVWRNPFALDLVFISRTIIKFKGTVLGPQRTENGRGSKHFGYFKTDLKHHRGSTLTYRIYLSFINALYVSL